MRKVVNLEVTGFCVASVWHAYVHISLPTAKRTVADALASLHEHQARQPALVADAIRWEMMCRHEWPLLGLAEGSTSHIHIDGRQMQVRVRSQGRRDEKMTFDEFIINYGTAALKAELATV